MGILHTYQLGEHIKTKTFNKYEGNKKENCINPNII